VAISQICRLSEEVLTGDLLEAVFIDQAIKDPNSKEADAEFVLQATYPTVPLRGLDDTILVKRSYYLGDANWLPYKVGPAKWRYKKPEERTPPDVCRIENTYEVFPVSVYRNFP